MVDTTGLTFLFMTEADALDAFVSRLVPGDDGDPGASQTGVVSYIDRALSGPYAARQFRYRDGLRALNAHAVAHHGAMFAKLDAAEQNRLIGEMEAGSAAGVDASGGRELFLMIWADTIEGMFSDPSYGGNRDGRGWKLIGFPGPRYGFTADDMRYGKDLTKDPITTLADIRVLAREQPELFFRRSGSGAQLAPRSVPTPPAIVSISEPPDKPDAMP